MLNRSSFHSFCIAEWVACAALSAAVPPALTLPLPLRAVVDSSSLALPAVGDTTLLILTPTLLELTVISTNEKNSPWTKLKGALGLRAEAPTPSTPPTAPAFVITVNGLATPVTTAGTKRRVHYAPLVKRDLRVATQFYLQLAAPLPSGATVVLCPPAASRSAAPTNTTAFSATATFSPDRLSPAIHINQEGYVPSFPKRAMIGYYLGDHGELEIPSASGFELIDATTGATVFRGELTPRRDVGYTTSPLPYQRVLAADFSAFTTTGEYRLHVPGLGASLPFLIDDGIALAFARTYALGLYHQRCGCANALPFTRFVHAACHLAPAQIPFTAAPPHAFTWATLARTAAEPSPDNPRQTAPLLMSPATQLYPFVNQGAVDVTGGHHDAGDYSKYTINSTALLHYLVFTADSVPGAAALDHLGVPESGDGLSDLLQAAKHEADFLAKLQDADGGFYFLVYPQTRKYEFNVLPERGDAQVVWPKNTAVTAAAVAALAQSASSPSFRRHFPDDAARYLRQALLGWQFLSRAIAKHGKVGAYQKITFYGDHYTHDDELAWAACELFLATGKTAYRDQLFAWFPNPADYATFRWGWWRMSESWGNAIRSYAFAARSGRLPATALDARYLRLCEGEILAAADNALEWSAKNAYATPFPLATKRVRGAGWYFSLDQASDLAVAYQLEPKPAYLEALVGALNYEAGTNPVNVTYLTGLGTRRQREIVHQYAQNDRRALPPTGLPLGNLQTAFQHLPPYGAELRDATYPDDNAPVAPFPFYDRWSDTFNVTTEFIAVNQARALLSTVALATLTPAATAPSPPLPVITIVAPTTSVPLNTPVTLRLSLSPAPSVPPSSPPSLSPSLTPVLPPQLNLARARIVWEARDQQPAFGPTYTITPRANGPHWVEAELAWPDGRRAFAAATFTADSANVTWIDDALPTDATPASSGGDSWHWISASSSPLPSADATSTSSATTPATHSGTRAHQSNLAAGLHEHWFTQATATLTVAVGDTLYAWVFLDPQNPPTELMLLWHDGTSWEHRAYWGANHITYGTDRSAGRHFAGPLPATGRWIRLSVPARAVALEGATVSGMGFALFDGRATWDEAGRTTAGTR